MHKNFEINDKQVEVDCSNYYIKDEEIKMTICDILNITRGTTIVKNKEFNVGDCSDVGFQKVIFKGCKDDKLYFNVTM